MCRVSTTQHVTCKHMSKVHLLSACASGFAHETSTCNVDRTVTISRERLVNPSLCPACYAIVLRKIVAKNTLDVERARLATKKLEASITARHLKEADLGARSEGDSQEASLSGRFAADDISNLEDVVKQTIKRGEETLAAFHKGQGTTPWSDLPRVVINDVDVDEVERQEPAELEWWDDGLDVELEELVRVASHWREPVRRERTRREL
ncbi:MAG: hypothetical protein M1827_001123 [Pycnora praestabilis]|nr:MAG: hypothetical protein M1827_001123 [Pycnora praestabilis]